MAEGTVTVQGLNQLVSTMRKAGMDLKDLKDANFRAAQIVAQWASVTAPRRTGALGSSVRAGKAAGRARVMVGSASVLYAGPIHFGWPARHIAANPWIYRAAEATRPAWESAYATDIQAVVDRVRGI